MTAVLAQVRAEVVSRLRSPATLVALLLVFAGSTLWIPDPRSNASSLSWTLPDGRVQAPLYDAAYIGFASTTLVAIFVPLVGFYLVAGSVRRDRECGVGAILAATPLSKSAYLLGKGAAHTVYLLAVSGLAALAGLLAFWRFGEGPFSAWRFLAPFVLLGLPTIVTTAALAVLFDVTPGLRGRAGLVLWFFVFMLVLIALPLGLAGGEKDGVPSRFPLIDPAGAATEAWLARETLPEVKGISTGLLIADAPPERVPWPGIAITPRVAVARAFNVLLAIPILLAAIAIFDRFDPARARRAGRSRRAQAARPIAVPSGSLSGESGRRSATAPADAHPSTARAILAEARLIWDTGSWFGWALLAASTGGALLPSSAAPAFAAAFFLILVPAISEVAAREQMAGTSALVHSQPGVPSSPVLWKAAASSLFALLLAAPLLARTLLAGPARAAGLAAGLLFVSASATALAAMTSGGKLFSGSFLVLWYAAINRVPGADFAGIFSDGASLSTPGLYLLVGASLLATALQIEKLQRHGLGAAWTRTSRRAA
ncbi:MAG: ABC transporter permease subunit [Acidobacteriota bacterium]